MNDDLRQQYFEQLQDYMLGSKDRELNPYVSKDKLKEVLWKLEPEQRMDADVESVLLLLKGR